MANSWLRLWHDMPNDPKWRTIARASKQSIPAVIAVYLHLLVNASNATERGRTQNVCSEDIASALDLDYEQVDAIIGAMQGRVLDDDRITGWKKRQVEREDGGAERSKAWREAQKREKEQETNANERNRTQLERNRTPDKDTDKERITTEAIASQSSKEEALSCPILELVDLYHNLMPLNPRLKVLNDQRKRLITARWKEAAKLAVAPFGYGTRADGLSAWEEFFKICSESTFLTGRSKPSADRPPFLADIDFIFSSSGFAKTLENKYHREVA